MNTRRLILLLLIAATVVVYAPVIHYPFVNYDDPSNVYENPHVTKGLSAAGIKWAFTSGTEGMWLPLTWLSLMADAQVYGVSAGGFHLTNLLWHIVNTLLLFGLFRRLTGAAWRSAWVAAMFALHPLHVETVAWVTERRDVLSTAFWLLTMWAYANYAQLPSRTRYALIWLPYLLGLMAKPMLVTLPVVMILMDLWPLRRTLNLRLIAEKLPFLLPAIVISVIAVHFQKGIGTAYSFEALPLTTRLEHMLIAYVRYIGHTVWPTGLVVFYPYPRVLPVTQVVGAGLLLLVVTWFVIRWAGSRPYLAMGWGWYLVTLSPVIGLVQVGAQAMTDHYSYVPLIGLFVVVAWGAPEILTKRPWLPVLGVGTILVCIGLTRQQLRYWRDSRSLFEHALAVTRDNWMAHNGLGIALSQQGQLDEARRHFLEAIRLNPGQAALHKNLANVLVKQDELTAAIDEYHIALQLKPHDPDVIRALATAHYNLAGQLAKQGQSAAAIRHLQAALRLQPDDPQANYNLANLLLAEGHATEAIPHYEAARRVRPHHAETHTNLGNAFLAVGRKTEAIAQYREALRLDPQQVAARHNLAVALAGRH